MQNVLLLEIMLSQTKGRQAADCFEGMERNLPRLPNRGVYFSRKSPMSFRLNDLIIVAVASCCLNRYEREGE